MHKHIIRLIITVCLTLLMSITALTALSETATLYKTTYFWTFIPEDELGQLSTNFVNLLDIKGQVIASVPLEVAERLAMEGSGFLPRDPQYVEPDSMAGELLNLANDDGWPNSRFFVVDKIKYPWGMSSLGKGLEPYYTIAVDPDVIPLGTTVYIPEFDGFRLPDGFTTKDGSPIHDGIFYAGDISYSFTGAHIDIFVGKYNNYLYTYPKVPNDLALTMLPKPTPYKPVPHYAPGKIEAEHYNQGGEGIAYHDSSIGNEGVWYRNDNVDLEYCNEGGYNIGWITEGEWLAYDVTADSTYSYELDLRISCWKSGQTLHVEVDGNDVTGQIVIPQTDVRSQWTTMTINNITMAPGKHTIKIYFHTGSVNLNWLEFRPGQSVDRNLSLEADPAKIIVSGQFSAFYNKAMAVDGNANTAWGSEPGAKLDYIVLDLDGISYTKLTKLLVKFYSPYHATQFQLGVSNTFSNNLEDWLLSSVINNSSETFSINVEQYNLNYRYILLLGTAKNMSAIGVREFEIWGR